MDYLWGVGDRPALGSMVSTAFFDDVGVDDATTGEEEIDTTSFGAGCGVREAGVIATGVCDLLTQHDLATWRVTCNLSHDTGDASQCNVPFGVDVPPILVALTIHTSPDGSTWTLWESPTVGTGANTESGTFTAVQARYVAAVLSSSLGTYDELDAISATVRLTDFRVTGTPVGGCTPPDTPANLAVGEVCSEDGDSLPLSWDASTVGDTPITYELRQNGGSIVYTGSATETTVTGLTTGEEYCFEVRATNACGSSEWSDAECGTPNAAPPTPTLVASLQQGGIVHAFSWAAVARATGYSLYRVVEGVEVLIYSGTDLEYEYFVPHEARETQQTYRLYATNACGASVASAATVGPYLSPVDTSECGDSLRVDGATCGSFSRVN
jgi:hypothetical protein